MGGESGEGQASQRPSAPPTAPLLPALTDVLRNKGHEAAAASPGLDRCDVEYVRHHGEQLDIWDGAAGGLRGQLEAGLALPGGSHAVPGHAGAA